MYVAKQIGRSFFNSSCILGHFNMFNIFLFMLKNLEIGNGAEHIGTDAFLSALS